MISFWFIRTEKMQASPQGLNYTTIPSVQWNTVVLNWVSHMISLQPLIPICPSGDVSKRTTAALTDTLPWAPVHPFHPSMPLPLQSRIMSLSEIQLRDLGPVVCSAAQISRLFPLLKPPLAPELAGRWEKKNRSSVGQVWPLFQQDKLARGMVSKSPWM